MRRLWIILMTEIKAWSKDPLIAVSGLIPPIFILLAFGLMFGARPTFRIALINHDRGTYGDVLKQTFAETISPFDVPYYDILSISEDEAWKAFQGYRIDGIWVIPQNFSEALEKQENPKIDMYFSNYIDDLAKNHRIYQSEVFWQFYKKIGMPDPPMEMRENYPLPKMIGWFPIIGVGVTLMSFILGGMMNILTLTYKEQVSKITIEFGMSPFSLGWVFIPKIFLALVMSLITGTIFLGILYLSSGYWPYEYLWAVLFLSGLTAIFWISTILLVGLHARHFMGTAIGIVLTGITVFFIGGGLLMVRNNTANVPWFSWLFPNTHAVDPLRDLILFHSWPVDWNITVIKLTIFALAGVILGITIAARKLRSVN